MSFESPATSVQFVWSQSSNHPIDWHWREDSSIAQKYWVRRRCRWWLLVVLIRLAKETNERRAGQGSFCVLGGEKETGPGSVLSRYVDAREDRSLRLKIEESQEDAWRIRHIQTWNVDSSVIQAKKGPYHKMKCGWYTLRIEKEEYLVNLQGGYTW
jgi:hypothetical protein